jgi:hypothetical protein
MRIQGDFLADLEGLGQQLSDPQSILTEVGEQITSEMKRLVPVDTGSLRNSISYTITDDQLTINTLYYGMFQNYGVNGTRSIGAAAVPFGINLRPSSEPFYAFKTREFGLAPQTFFNLESTTNQIADAFAAAVNEDF